MSTRKELRALAELVLTKYEYPWCVFCGLSPDCCVAQAVDDEGAHERYYRAMNVTGSRPLRERVDQRRVDKVRAHKSATDLARGVIELLEQLDDQAARERE